MGDDFLLGNIYLSSRVDGDVGMHAMFFLHMNTRLLGLLLLHYQHVHFREEISRQVINTK